MTSIELQVGGVNGVPIDAELAALHVAVVGSTEPGFVTVWPCDGGLPLVSSVNYAAGQVVQSLILAKLDASGAVCFYVLETTDLVVDVAGYVPVGSDLRALDTPTRVVDTRFSAPVRTGQEFRLPVGGRDGIPADAGGVGFTVTAVNGVAPGFLTVYPCGERRPLSSSLNWIPGQVVPNFVLARVGASGEVCIWSLSEVDIVVDLVAWMPSDATGVEFLERPSRVLDSRFGTGSPARPFGDGESRRIPVGAPEGAVAVIGNIAAAEQAGPGFATVYPCGEPVPTTASLNWTGPPVAVNSSLGALGVGGEPCVFSLHPTELIYDVTGFVTSPDFFTPMTPFRLYDSREGWREQCPFVPIRSGENIVLFRADGQISDDPRFAAPPDLDRELRLAPDCRSIIARNSRTGQLLRIAVSDGSVSMLGPIADGAQSFDVTADGRILVVGIETRDGADYALAGDRRLVVADAVTGDILGRSGYEPITLRYPQVVATAVSADGRHAAVVAAQSLHGRKEMIFADLHSGETVKWSLHDGYSRVYGMHIAPDGRSFVINGEETIQEGDQPPESYQTFRVVSADGRVLRTGAVRSIYPIAAAYRGNGRLLACTAAGAFDEVMFADVSVIEWFAVPGFSTDPYSEAGIGCTYTLID